MEKTFDTIVVGLGAMGSAAAYQLAARKQRVLGIDRFSPPHTCGSSHGDTRITRLAIGEGDHYVPLALRSHDLWRSIEKQTKEKLLTITGGLIIGNDRAPSTHGAGNFVQRTVEAAVKYGIDHQVLSAEEIRRCFPQFNVEDDEVAYYEEQAGFVRPEACVRVQLGLAEGNGAEIHRNERVLEVLPCSGGDGVCVRTERGCYEAGQAILTVGAWIKEFVRREVGSLFTIHREVPYWFDAPGRMSSFQAGVFPIFIWVSRRTMDILYGFPAIDGPDGGVKVATEQFSTATTPDALSDSVTAEEMRAMQAGVLEYLPCLSGRCVKTAPCLYTCTPDFGFAIDRLPEHPQIIVASPCSGHGFKHSPAIGEMLAELAVDGETTIDRQAFSWNRRQAAQP